MRLKVKAHGFFILSSCLCNSANNQSTIFFGTERRGNNGTTAFDFEFNQKGTEGHGRQPVKP